MTKELIRFVLVGVINTASTYGIYLIFLSFLPYIASYSISYIMGIVIAYSLNSKFVFKQKMSIIKFLKFPIVYLVQYLINVFMLYTFVQLNIDKIYAPIIVLVLSIPISFILSKYIITGKK